MKFLEKEVDEVNSNTSLVSDKQYLFFCFSDYTSNTFPVYRNSLRGISP